MQCSTKFISTWTIKYRKEVVKHTFIHVLESFAMLRLSESIVVWRCCCSLLVLSSLVVIIWNVPMIFVLIFLHWCRRNIVTCVITKDLTLFKHWKHVLYRLKRNDCFCSNRYTRLQGIVLYTVMLVLLHFSMKDERFIEDFEWQGFVIYTVHLLEIN